MRLISPLHSTRQSRVFAASAVVILAIFAFMLFLSFSSRVQAISSNVVISEFRVRGPNGAADEFVELYNLSSGAVDISGWKISGSNNTAGVSVRATVGAGVSIPSHGHYLITNSSASGGPYSGL